MGGGLATKFDCVKLQLGRTAVKPTFSDSRTCFRKLNLGVGSLYYSLLRAPRGGLQVGGSNRRRFGCREWSIRRLVLARNGKDLN